MPKLTILSDGRPTYSTPGRLDLGGVISFDAGSGDTVLCALDLTAWVGSSSLSGTSWVITNGTLGATTSANNVPTALVTLPTVATYPTDPLMQACTVVQHTATAADGRSVHTTFRIYAQAR